MDQELMALTQRERDRLDWLRQAKRKQITQAKAAERMGVSERWVRQLLQRMKTERDRVVVHKLRGRPSNRRIGAERREQIVKILSEPVYAGYGPTLASERLKAKHQIQIGREALRQVMIPAGLWRPRRRKPEAIHTWRERRSRFGELVQWDSSTHNWLEGRGPQLKLIRMIDDASSRSLLRFVEHDSAEENLRVLERWLRTHGRMLSCYTDKAGLFVTTQKHRRDRPGEEVDARQMPPTQIGRALRELGITHTTAHSPQAKGRVERAFGTDQDRLVKGLREVQACTLEQANQYLEQVYEPWWEACCTVCPADAANAHRPLGPEHDLDSILSFVQLRQVQTDYTVQFQGSKYQIHRADVVTGLRGARVRVEQRLDGTVHLSFQGRYLRWGALRDGAEGSSPAEAGARRETAPPDHELAADSVGPTVRSDEGHSGLAGGPRAGLIPHMERRAKAARRASRLLAQDLRSEASPPGCGKSKSKTPEQRRSRVLVVPIRNGASPVASALGVRSGATPCRRTHSNIAFSDRPLNPELSIWQRIGTFYLALT